MPQVRSVLWTLTRVPSKGRADSLILRNHRHFAVGLAPGLYGDFHVLAQGGEEVHEPLDGNPAAARAAAKRRRAELDHGPALQLNLTNSPNGGAGHGAERVALAFAD